MELSYVRNSSFQQILHASKSLELIQSSFLQTFGEYEQFPKAPVLDVFNQMKLVLGELQSQAEFRMRNPFDLIPKEILSLIFSMVSSTKDLTRLSLCCQRFRDLILQEYHLYVEFCEK